MPKRVGNILMLYGSSAHTEDILGEQMLIVDTSVAGWKVALDAKAAAKLRAQIDSAFPSFAGPRIPS